MDRRTMGEVIAKAVTGQRTAADAAALSLTMATGPGTYGKMRPDYYRRHVDQGLDVLEDIDAALGDLVDLITYYRLLWPEAHDDHPEGPGLCACGRDADTCPARAAAEAGELTWDDEHGTTHDLDQAAPLDEAEAPAEQQ